MRTISSGIVGFVCLVALNFWSGLAWADSIFRVRLLNDPITFDWNLAQTDAETPVMMNIMEGLVEFGHDMKVKPLLASSWSVSSDQKTYTFKIRNNIKWSDGKELTSADFLYSWKRLLSPLTAAPYAYMLFDIEGAEDYNARKLTDFAKVGIKALDPYTIQVRLTKPVAYFIQMFTFWVTFPLRQDVVEKYGSSWSQPGKTVVLGPFEPSSYQPQSQIVLKRNGLYHGKKPQLDSVVFKIINDDSTALNLFRSKQLDFVRPVNFLELNEYKGKSELHTDPYYRTCFININTAKYPFNLAKVRQAIAGAIDRSKLAAVLHRDIKAATSLMPELLYPEGKASVVDFDPSSAKKLLADTVGESRMLPSVELTTFSSDENALSAQFIQDQLKRNLGLSVKVQMPEYSTYRQNLKLGTSGLYFRCWAADYADPDTFFSAFLSSSGNNLTGFKSPKYDELVKKAASSPSRSDRNKLYKQALEILLKQEAPLSPLYFDALTYLLNPSIKNFVINPLNYAFFKDVVIAH